MITQEDELLVKRILWKVSNQIRDTVDHIKFNFWDYFSKTDVDNTGYVTVLKFRNVLNKPLNTLMKLKDEEIETLVKYFGSSDGLVKYGEFCEMIHNQPKPKDEGLTVKNENDSDLKYTQSDLPRLSVMKKIALHSDKFDIMLEPYIKDYEELTLYNGQMTNKHFKFMLNTFKIPVSHPEIKLITDKLSNKYVLDTKKFIDELNWVRRNDPETVLAYVNVEPKIVRDTTELNSNGNVFHPVIENKTQQKDDVITIIRNIQNIILEKCVYIEQYFEQYDPFKVGYITETQFRRCLDSMGISSLNGLNYSEVEINSLIQMYRDKDHPERINWKEFAGEINSTFNKSKLDKISDVEVTCTRDPDKMLRIRGHDWEGIDPNLQTFFESTMLKLKFIIDQRRIYLNPYFKQFDKNNHGNTSRNCFRRVLYMVGINSSEEELSIIEKRFMNVNRFHYLQFLDMLNDISVKIEKCENKEISSHDANQQNLESGNKINNKTLKELLNRIKITVIRNRIDIKWFLNQFDDINHGVSTKDNFHRALDLAGVHIDEDELQLLFDEFESKTYPGLVNYRRFNNVIDEAFATQNLRQNPTVHPKTYLPTYESPSNHLTDSELAEVTSALSKVRNKANVGLDDMFRDYDELHQGMVSVDKFLGILGVCKLNMLLTLNEIKCLKKAYCREDRAGMFNYRAFMMDLW